MIDFMARPLGLKAKDPSFLSLESEAEHVRMKLIGAEGSLFPHHL